MREQKTVAGLHCPHYLEWIIREYPSSRALLHTRSPFARARACLCNLIHSHTHTHTHVHTYTQTTTYTQYYERVCKYEYARNFEPVFVEYFGNSSAPRQRNQSWKKKERRRSWMREDLWEKQQNITGQYEIECPVFTTHNLLVTSFEIMWYLQLRDSALSTIWKYLRKWHNVCLHTVAFSHIFWAVHQ